MSTTRTISADEYAAWFDAISRGFHFTPPSADVVAHRRKFVDLDRTWGSYDDDFVAGTLRSFPTTVSMPGGGLLPAAAITNVTVATIHRRRGLLTDMITADLRACRDRGEPLSVLIASEYPIYGRFGFGVATECVRWRIERRAVRFRRPPLSTVRFVDRAEARRIAPLVLAAHRTERAGEIDREDWRMDLVLGVIDLAGPTRPDRFAASFDRSGTPTGYVSYRVDDRWEQRRPKGTLEVVELVAATDDAHAALWKLVCDIELIETIEVNDRAVDDPLPWLLDDARAVRQLDRSDLLWLRVLDVPATLAGRHYDAAGTVVLEVADRLGLAGGRFRLEVDSSGHATCAPTTDSPDLELPVDALGTLVLGGGSGDLLARSHRASERTSGAVGVVDRLFRTSRMPMLSTWF